MAKIQFRGTIIGHWVWYWLNGDREGDPLPALVTRKYKGSGSLSLTMFAEGERNVHLTRDGVRHVEDPEYAETHRKEVGAWERIPAS